MTSGWITHVIRNDGAGTYVESPHPTARVKFQLKRDLVYTRRKMKLYGLAWTDCTNVLTNMRRWKLEVAGIVAMAHDDGLMSFCWIEVDGSKRVQHRWMEEDFAGHGGFPIVVLRGTQHVIALLEERARKAEEAMNET